MKWRGQKNKFSENREFLSAFFKIKNLDTPSEKGILEDMMKNFSIVENDDNGLMSSLVDRNVFKEASLF